MNRFALIDAENTRHDPARKELARRLLLLCRVEVANYGMHLHELTVPHTGGDDKS